MRRPACTQPPAQHENVLSMQHNPVLFGALCICRDCHTRTPIGPMVSPHTDVKSAWALGNVVMQVSTNGPNLAIHEPGAPGAERGQAQAARPGFCAGVRHAEVVVAVVYEDTHACAGRSSQTLCRACQGTLVLDKMCCLSWVRRQQPAQERSNNRHGAARMPLLSRNRWLASMEGWSCV